MGAGSREQAVAKAGFCSLGAVDSRGDRRAITFVWPTLRQECRQRLNGILGSALFSIFVKRSHLTDSSRRFVTERTGCLRKTELSKMDEWAIGQIEEHGCALISVAGDCKDDFGWTYSFGIYDTCGQPELIAVGLPPEVAKFCLSELDRRMR